MKVIVKLCKKEDKKKDMCKPLNNLSGKTVDELIEEFEFYKYIPVDLNKILDKYDVSTRSTDFEDLRQEKYIAEMEKERGEILGAVAVWGDNLRILYKKDDTFLEQKFTIAHELAHCCLNADALQENGHIEFRTEFDEKTDSKIEIQANNFAMNLLIPTLALKKIYARTRKPKLQAIAKAFNVSTELMRKKLDGLGLDYYESSPLTNQFLINFTY